MVCKITHSIWAVSGKRQAVLFAACRIKHGFRPAMCSGGEAENLLSDLIAFHAQRDAVMKYQK
jgi:hypothetical protein